MKAIVKKKSCGNSLSAITILFTGLLLFGRPGIAQVLPTPQQVAWQQAGMGVVFHYDLHVFDGKPYNQTSNRITPVPDYNIFQPSRLNTDQWISAAKAAGAKFAILTVTHETGFALYRSDVNPYCLKALKWRDGKADIVADFVESCHKFGIKPGLYIGIRWNAFLGVHDFKVQGGDHDSTFRHERQLAYNRMCEGMVKELCTRYGELFEIWFDGGASDPADGSPDVLPVVERYQPNTLFYWNGQRSDARWGGSESGTIGDPCWSTFPYPSMLTSRYPAIAANQFALAKHGDKDGRYWMPAMADAPLRGYNGRHEWFWEPGDEAHIYPLAELVNMYYHSVGRNATLLLGLTPDTSGLLPAPDVARLEAFGAAIRQRLDTPLQGTLTPVKQSAAHLSLQALQPVNQVVIREDISKGERVRAYTLDAKVNGRWTTLFKGTAVGNMRIITFPAVRTAALRLRINESIAAPVLLSFSAYHVPGVPVDH
ncbi:alpha-L-fucosidase [Chitinophaga arvensicola]|uniref:alpha-L-fucosidase n=1 Tax=Chitinophaga arvensicola TaxID=29529 RepID=A0A1I0SBB6_9BACT|nr:alpha-L-fucosidase [Chitinophaga arvensicola]SEW53888.1 Alpha-L-fucosidase [Chitinophaga arvensicola]